MYFSTEWRFLHLTSPSIGRQLRINLSKPRKQVVNKRHCAESGKCAANERYGSKPRKRQTDMRHHAESRKCLMDKRRKTKSLKRRNHGCYRSKPHKRLADRFMPTPPINMELLRCLHMPMKMFTNFMKCRCMYLASHDSTPPIIFLPASIYRKYNISLHIRTSGYIVVSRSPAIVFTTYFWNASATPGKPVPHTPMSRNIITAFIMRLPSFPLFLCSAACWQVRQTISYPIYLTHFFEVSLAISDIQKY